MAEAVDTTLKFCGVPIRAHRSSKVRGNTSGQACSGSLACIGFSSPKGQCMAHPPPPPRALHTTLLRPTREVRKLFRGLATGRDVADLLELDWSQLKYITSSRNYAYTVFAIPKNRPGQRRIIQAPHLSVKILQRKLLSILYLVYEPHPAAHGFARGRSIVTNASCHQRKKFVLNVDIEQFFPSITFPRVRGLFIKHFGIGEAAATVLARICCNTGDSPDHLPQGAPTSPIISNMI